MQQFLMVYSIDDYPDCGGGIQPPIIIHAYDEKEAIKQAKEEIIKHGTIKNTKYRVDGCELYKVQSSCVVDIDSMNQGLRLTEEDKLRQAKREAKKKALLNLMKEFPEEVEKYKKEVVDPAKEHCSPPWVGGISLNGEKT